MNYHPTCPWINKTKSELICFLPHPSSPLSWQCSVFVCPSVFNCPVGTDTTHCCLEWWPPRAGTGSVDGGNYIARTIHLRGPKEYMAIETTPDELRWTILCISLFMMFIYPSIHPSTHPSVHPSISESLLCLAQAPGTWYSTHRVLNSYFFNQRSRRSMRYLR